MEKKVRSSKKKNFENKRLKNSTDIIIFTDGYCYSSCSDFVKAFQDTGGAIIVGYNGNPTIEGRDEFDASQSPSSVATFTTKEYYELKKLGYEISGITFSESFDDSYQNKTEAPIPREYTVDLVDRRVPIFGPYSDELYTTFISYATEIFNEFKTKCSKNNKRLLLDDEDNCKFEDHRKGGHPCNENEEWDKGKCEAYYCDLGYYYDQFKKECVLDRCTNLENEKDIYAHNISSFLETQEYTVQPGSEITFHLNNDSYLYFIESSLENTITEHYLIQGLKNCTSFCIIKYQRQGSLDYEVNVNYFGNIKETSKVKFTAVERNPNIIIPNVLYSDPFYFSAYAIEQGEKIYINSFQFKSKTIIFTPTFNKGLKAYYHEYNNNLLINELYNIDPSKFKECTNELLIMEERKNYIYFLKFPKDITSNALFFFNLYDLDEDISITKERFVYLSQQNFVYNLHFNSESDNIYIKLCSQTIDAEIEIGENKILLNKSNRYFLWNKSIKELPIKLKNNNCALLEFYYEIYNAKSIDINETKIILDSGKNNILKIKKSNKIESIKILLETEINSEITLYSNFGKENYLAGIPNSVKLDSNNITTELFIPNDQLTDDDTFNILFKTEKNATLSIELKKQEENNDNGGGDEKDDFPTWALIVIIVVGILVLIAIQFIIIRCAIKNKMDAERIEKENYF